METVALSGSHFKIMKLVSLLLCLLIRDGRTTSAEPGSLQSSSGSDSFHQASPDSGFEEFKRRGWGKRSALDEETALRVTEDGPSSAPEGKEDADANESVVADLMGSSGWDNMGQGFSPEICDEMDFDRMMEKRRGWGKRDLLLEKRRGWGKRDLREEEDKRRGWGKRGGDWALEEEKRRGWGKRDVVEKRRGWGKRDALLKIVAQGEEMSNEARTCPRVLQALHYHGCLAMKAEEILNQLSCSSR